MKDPEVSRSIRFPKQLWEQIDKDAKRCRRSSVKQMEALLTSYYLIDSVDINQVALEWARLKTKRDDVTNSVQIIETSEGAVWAED